MTRPRTAGSRRALTRTIASSAAGLLLAAGATFTLSGCSLVSTPRTQHPTGIHHPSRTHRPTPTVARSPHQHTVVPTTGPDASFAGVTLPGGLRVVNTDIRATGSAAQVTAGVWASDREDTRALVDEVVTDNPTWMWQQAAIPGGTRATAAGAVAGQTAAVTVDAMYSPDASETLLRVIVTRYPRPGGHATPGQG